MKRIITFLLLFAALKVAGQTTGYLRFDTVRIMKQNGTCELYIINKTKDTIGVLYNVGGGLTQFKRIRQITDTSFVLGIDTIRIVGTGGGGGGSGTVTNVATGYGLSGGPITTTGTLLVDSATLSSYYLRRKDSTLYVTQTKLDDSTAAIRADITGGGGATDISITHNLTNTVTHSSTGLDGTNNFAKTTLAGVLSPSSSDIGHLPEIKHYMWARGLQASASAANYPYTLIDSNRSKFSSSGPDRGGWLTNNLTGDSVQVRAPFWVAFGDSQAEGHGPTTTGRHGRLDPNGTSGFDPFYPDSTGQITYHLRFLTNMRWVNHGIGGNNTTQCLRRIYRDVVGRAGTYTNSDTKGNSMLWYKPQGVVIIVGINDVAQGVSTETIKKNLELMASICQQEGIQCVMLNLPGDEVFDTTQARKVETINKWLAAGVMDQYGATIVDYNSWWKDATANDNYTGSSLIADDIHPSKVGYDSLSNYIFRSAHLPVLKRAIFINELNSGGFTGYSRPTGFTIGGGPNGSPTAYTIANAIDSITITAPVWDSTWIHTTAVTTVTGTTFSGWGSIIWYTENNIDTLRVTKRTLYNNGSQKSDMTISKMTIIPPSYASTDPVLSIPLADITTNFAGLRVWADGGGVWMTMNGLTTDAKLNTAVLSIYAASAGSNSIGTNGQIKATGTKHQFGELELGTNSTGSTFGFGIFADNTLSGMSYQSSAMTGNKSDHSLEYYFTSLSAANTALGAVANTMKDLVRVKMGLGNAGNSDQKGNALNITPVLNQTAAQTGIQFNGVRYVPDVQSLTNTLHRGFFNTKGNNYFNALLDNTGIGIDSNTTLTALLHLGASTTTRASLRLPSGTAPTAPNHGDMWTDADHIYSRLNGVTYQLDQQGGGTDIYAADGTIAANRTLTGATRTLTFTGLSAFNMFATNFTFAKTDGTFKYTGLVNGISDNTWQFGYLKGGSINPAIIIDTNNNVTTGASLASALPLYATGGSFYAAQGLQSGAGNFYKVRNVTTDGSAALTDYFITIDATGGNVTVTLPAASTSFAASIGIQYVFKRMDASGNTVTISRAGSDTIDGGTSTTLTTQYQVKEIQCITTSTWAIK